MNPIQPLRISWSQLNSAQFEELSCILLRRRLGEGFRIDGSGGDDGIDYLLESPTGRHIFQVKYFPGRLNGSRRRQISKSFETAIATNRGLCGWTLVTPADPTTGELNWLREATAGQGFVASWYGLNWLDEVVAEHQGLVMYMAGQVGTLREQARNAFNEEGAPLQVLGEVMQRLELLTSLIDSIAPNYSVQVSAGHRGNSIEMRSDEVLTIDMSALAVVAGPEVAENLAYGRGATFKARPSEIGLNDFPTGNTDSTWEIPVNTGPTAELRLEIVENRSTVVAQLHLGETRPTNGPGGVEVIGKHVSGWVRVRLRLSAQTNRGSLDLTIDPGEPARPEHIAELINFFDRAAPGARIRAVSHIAGRDHPIPPRPIADGLNTVIEPWFAQYVRDMMTIQRAVGESVPISASGPDDPTLANNLARQINGESVAMDGHIDIDLLSVPDVLADADPDGSAIVVDGEFTSVPIDGHTYNFAGWRHLLTCQRCVVVNIDEVREAARRGKPCHATLSPAAGQQWSGTIAYAEEPLGRDENPAPSVELSSSE